MDFIPIAGCQVKFAKWETRVSDFDLFLKDTGYDWNHKPSFPQSADHPVVNVNVADSTAFCEWLTARDRKSGAIGQSMIYRLPTNTEWDAASGVTASSAKESQLDKSRDLFPWGTAWPPPKGAGNFNSQQIDGTDDGYVYTAPVGSFHPSPCGLFDLAGNVWEWALDDKPDGAISATLRGGSWKYFRKECFLSSYKYQVPVSIRQHSIGFRCVLEDLALTRSLMVTNDSAEKKSRDLLGAVPPVNQSEVERMKVQMSSRKEHLSDNDKLAAMSRLLPSNSKRSPFINSLGMAFQPLVKGGVFICEHEVRVKDIEVWMVATNKNKVTPTFEQSDDHPAVNLSWTDAKMFCTWLTMRDHTLKIIDQTASYRLPTDSEWSAAAALPDEVGANPAEKSLRNKLDFPWGFEWPPFPNSANLDASGIERYKDDFPCTAPVGSFKANSLHLSDLAGNVSEWCEDEWPGSPGKHVVRGSSWRMSSKAELLSSARQHFIESEIRDDLGFRIVLINHYQ